MKISPGSLTFWLLGYGIAFGDGSVIGTTYFAAVGLPTFKYAHLFFQVRYHLSRYALKFYELKRKI